MGNNGVDLVGQVIGQRYRITQKLGSGGMGSVWRAHHVQSLQPFAIKTIRVTEDFPQTAVQRCLREARVAATLRSRNIVRITDVDSNYNHDGTPLPYLVMELLVGCDFENVLLLQGCLSVEHALWVLAQACRGVQMAHEQGVSHRDLKPANLFLTLDDDGQPLVKICDFGLAKATSRQTVLGDLSSTQTGMVFGTPRYMAPEQLRGLASSNHRIDQWAIGLIAFKLLSGKDYFDGTLNPVELSLRIIHDELQRPSLCSGRVPQAFDEWFFRSCARNPSRRFRSVQAQHEALLAAFRQYTPMPLVATAARAAPSEKPAASIGHVGERIDTRHGTTGRVPEGGRKPTLTASTLVTMLFIFASAHWVRAARSQALHSARIPVEPAAAEHPATQTLAITQEFVKPATHASVSERKQAMPVPSTRVEVPRSRARKALALRALNAASVSPRPVSSATSEAAPLGPGAACVRSTECSSRLCVAERCR